MRHRQLHPWDVSPKQAVEIQRRLREQVCTTADFQAEAVQTVAGADIALDVDANVGYAGVIVYRLPGLDPIERVHASVPLRFPYVPGLLAFREAPVLLAAFEKLKTQPDVLIFDGHGLAHPRRFGIASHMGVLLDHPSIGCAKSRLCGQYVEPGAQSGQWTPLMDGEHRIGAVLRTRDHVKPVFVSVGHRIDLPTAVAVVLRCLDGYRIPKPTRQADQFVGQLKQGHQPPPEQPGLFDGL